MEFAEFYQAVHGQPPFPWQAMLAAQVVDKGRWPRLIDLPTASGKTAVIDVAVWVMAREAAAKTEPQDRRMPRRIWLVVDRRIVVDEAARRAEKIQGALLTNDKLAPVRDALLSLSGTNLPLAVDRLRGGGQRFADATIKLPNDAWQTVPSQPAVLTSTVDQLGSRLLFRGYGMGPGNWPVHAALAGNDSLVVLDEAHIAEPLRQTLAWVEKYRAWGEDVPRTPWHFAVMTATPRSVSVTPGDEWPRFPTAEERDAALTDANGVLPRRMNARKPAELVDPVGDAKKRDDAKLAAAIAAKVAGFVENGRQRVAVMLNRVDSAAEAERQLRKDLGDKADVRLLTGRMRPVDRHDFLETLTPTLKAGSEVMLDRPIVLVTTQCLEVGADFDFDALVTECADLSSLRQRFGRLARLGSDEPAPAAILACACDVAEGADDPIYGTALAATWRWLKAHATDGKVDFGINHLPKPGDAEEAALFGTPPDAPTLLPAYLDAWCQTGPRPAVEAEISLFLHGPRDDAAEVGVVFRADLDDAADADKLADAVRLLPPAQGETLPVRLGRLRAWLAGDAKFDADTDLEGAVAGEVNAPKDSAPPTQLVRYRGRDETKALRTRNLPANALRPGDVVVLPAPPDGRMPAALGTMPAGSQIDVFERANAAAGRRVTVRLTTATARHLLPGDENKARRDAVVKLFQEAAEAITQVRDGTDEEADEQDHLDALARGLDGLSADDAADPLDKLVADLRKRDWIKNGDDGAELRPAEYELHPIVGLVLYGKRPERPPLIDPFGDADEQLAADRNISEADRKLAKHQADVSAWAAAFARSCLPESMGEIFREAGSHHDDGKADPRFQGLLAARRSALVLNASADMLAKSERRLPWARERWLREHLNLPADFRHEMVSLQLAARRGVGADLPLHLLASHHGHARPFAPVCLDGTPWEVAVDGVTLSGDERKKDPPHALGSGVAERFWSLTRRHGWWGLAYLETILRLADRHASRFPEDAKADSFAATRSPSSGVLTNREREVVLLGGINPVDPLGFLAALGTVFTCERLDLEPRLHFQVGGGGYQPVLSIIRHGDADIFTRIDDLLQADFADGRRPDFLYGDIESEKPPKTYGNIIACPPDEYRRRVVGAVELQQSARWLLYLFAGFACETIVQANGGQAGQVEPTNISLANGSSQRYLLHDYQTLVLGKQGKMDAYPPLTPPSLRRGIVETTLLDERHAELRWSPTEYRPGALNRVGGTSQGKNAMAFWSLGLLPSFPTNSGLVTAGFTSASARSEASGYFNWPLWDKPLTADAIRSLMLMEYANRGDENPFRSDRGFHQVLRCARFSGEKGGLFFSPAVAV